MGSSPYLYIVPYTGDVQDALDSLREREFAAGRYNPVMDQIQFPITDESPAPRSEHDSIEDALEDSGEEGTRSILDIALISQEPEFFAACALSNETLKKLFGTARPTRQMAVSGLKFLHEYRIERGHAIYFLLYQNNRPVEILFAGYSVD